MKAADQGLGAPTLSVRFPPVWTHIQPLSTYAGAILEVKGKGNAAERVAIVVNELLENAVKYGDPAAEVTFELFADAGQAVVVRVTNKAHPSRVTILERELKRHATTSPKEAFARALERLQHLPEGSSMLGLSRVALEAELGIDTTGNLVVATAKIDAGAVRANVGLGKSPAKDGRADGEVESQQLREANSGVSQTRRAVGPLSSRSEQSNPSMKAAITADGSPKRR
jgi:hypothetical protein